MPRQSDILDLISDYKSKGEPFALATVVRTVSVTAAKAGAKAVIRADGTITEGWIGGGCARGAVLRAAREALVDGQSRLVSIQPDERLSEHQVKSGETRDGVVYAKNMCPSQGTMDVFVEPVLPRPNLLICGASPVAIALADLARRMGFFITVCAPAADHTGFGETDRLIDGYAIPADGSERDYVVIATQGRGDSAALKAAVEVPSKYLAFVGSRKKAAALKTELAKSGVSSSQLETIHAPAGIDIGAITPDEIAFSIVAEMIEIRRRGQRTL
ncbi:XdhC family protein [Hoeflea ulvae]|uniref:XdhC/CoxI family protein n=1 Tax=Hoeflea ulvae TaxID=2983764 RepID=A0ABT3YGL1_9HYPH|nr:XdhC/CoxI family protein [Hoeflea ulvae]MCY0094968.1 XdhC/CoxI family protein [Hoeflea ulvae]